MSIKTNTVIELQETPSFKKEFGIFLGLFTRTQNIQISVADALQNPALVNLFHATKIAYTSSVKEIEKEMPNAVSTRMRSFQQVELGSAQKMVLDFLKKKPGSTRREIAKGTNMRTCSVTARVHELLSKSLIYVCGEAFDIESSRNVQTLKAVPSRKQ